jgi:uncharacterized membrane protein
VDESRGGGFAKFALLLSLLTALAMAAYATLSFEAMPDRVPTLANLLGFGDELAPKSIVTVLLVPSMNLVLSLYFALMALLIATAKRSIRGGSGGRSAAAQDAFRIAMAHIVSGTALFLCLFLAVTSWEIVKVSLGQTESLGVSIVWAAGAMIVYMGVSLVRIMRSLGQGGALLETGSVEAPLTGGLADNAHWIWGVLYVDKDDPSLMVEDRFGLGYTLNLGNRTALLILVSFLTLSLGLVVLTLTQLRVFS